MKVARKLRKLPVGGSHTVLSKEGHTLLVIAIKKIPGSLILGIPSVYMDLLLSLHSNASGRSSSETAVD